MTAAFDTHSQTTRQGVGNLQRQCEKCRVFGFTDLLLLIPPSVDEARTSHSTALKADFDTLVQGAEDTYADLQEDLLERQEDMKVDRDDLVEMASSACCVLTYANISS